MKFNVEKTVFELLPNLVIAVPIIRGFDNTKGNEESVSMLREAESTIRINTTLENLFLDPRVKVYLEAFRAFGSDPELRRPAHVSLAKRILEGGQLPDINPLVNIYNAMSVKYLTPFGGENLDVLQGDFCLYVAKGGEIWFPIGGGKAKPALAGELVWGDDVDLSTRALNWRQCDRTKMTETTTNGFFIMDGFDGVNKDVMMRASEEFVQHVTALCGGSAVIYWLDRLHSSSPDIMI